MSDKLLLDAACVESNLILRWHYRLNSSSGSLVNKSTMSMTGIAITGNSNRMVSISFIISIL